MTGKHAWQLSSLRTRAGSVDRAQPIPAQTGMLTMSIKGTHRPDVGGHSQTRRTALTPATPCARGTCPHQEGSASEVTWISDHADG